MAKRGRGRRRMVEETAVETWPIPAWESRLQDGVVADMKCTDEDRRLERQVMDDVREIGMKEITDLWSSKPVNYEEVPPAEITRPVIKKERKPRKESFERMPEACPIITEILHECIGNTSSMSKLRNDLDNKLFDEVTSKFRNALTECVTELYAALDEKESLEKENERLHKIIEDMNDKA